MAGRVRLAFVVNDVDFLVSHRLVLVRGALDAGYDVAVVAPPGAGAAVLEGLGARFHPWGLERTGQRAWEEAYAIADLVRLYRHLKPELVHHVTIKPVLYGSFAARVTGVRGVVNAVSGLGYVFLARGPVARARRAAAAVAYRSATSGRRTVVILQNDDDERDLRAHGALGDARIVKIRGSGVDLTRFAPSSEPDGTPVVVLPARLLREKGVEEFAEAARLLSADGVRVRMALVGGIAEDNPAAVERARVEAWVASGVLEWWGHRSDMPAVFAQANIVCLPSYREGMPKVLLEAAASGRAIVTTDAPGCRDVLEGGRLGPLVPPRDAPALAAALRELIDDPARRRALGEALAQHARLHFDERKVLEAHLAVYRELSS